MPDAPLPAPESSPTAAHAVKQHAPRRVRLAVVAAGVLVGALALLGWLSSTTSGYVTVTPGPAFNVAQAIHGPDLNPALAKDRFYLTTVDENMASWWRYFTARAFGGATLLPAAPLPTNQSSSAVTVSENALMLESQKSAEAVAADRVGKGASLRPAGAEVVLVAARSAATRLGIRFGDVIVSVQGRPVATPAAAMAALDQVVSGSTLVLGVTRNGRVRRVTVNGYQGPGGLGVELAPSFSGASPYRIDIPGVGGPSGGLMMALAMTDALSHGSLAGHQVVAGTGELTGTQVLPIDGVAQKVVGAEGKGATVFFSPVADADAARQSAHGRLQVVAVATYTQALGWLCAHGATSSACR